MNKLTYEQNNDLAYAFDLIQHVKQDIEDESGNPKHGYKTIWKQIDSVLGTLENIR